MYITYCIQLAWAFTLHLVLSAVSYTSAVCVNTEVLWKSINEETDNDDGDWRYADIDA